MAGEISAAAGLVSAAAGLVAAVAQAFSAGSAKCWRGAGRAVARAVLAGEGGKRWSWPRWTQLPPLEARRQPQRHLSVWRAAICLARSSAKLVNRGHVRGGDDLGVVPPRVEADAAAASSNPRRRSSRAGIRSGFPSRIFRPP